MSVEVSHNPRFYNRSQTCGIRNPPECFCDATLLDRKFIATQGIPPPVDADRLVRNLDIRSDSQRHYSFRVFHDRVLLNPLSRGPSPPEIYYDDIIQLEILPRHSEILFILCGRVSVPVYYIFKLANPEVGDQMENLVKSVNPNVISGYQSTPPRNHQHQQIPARFPPPSTLRRTALDRDFSVPPSTVSEESDSRVSRSIVRQNSFIRWEGYRGPKRNNPASRSSRRKSSSGSRKRRNSDTTLFIKAHGRPSHRKVGTSRTKPKAKILLDTGYPETNRSATQSVDNHRKPVTMEVSKPRQGPKKLPKPRTFILDTSKSRRPIVNTSRQNIIDYDSDDSSQSDPDDDIQVGRHRYARYTRQPSEDYDWESEDSWDVMEERALANARGVNFNVPRPIPPQPAFTHREEEFDDDVTSTTEDSLYYEREQQLASRFAPRQTNYMPELQEMFHNFNMK